MPHFTYTISDNKVQQHTTSIASNNNVCARLLIICFLLRIFIEQTDYILFQSSSAQISSIPWCLLSSTTDCASLILKSLELRLANVVLVTVADLCTAGDPIEFWPQWGKVQHISSRGTLLQEHM